MTCYQAAHTCCKDHRSNAGKTLELVGWTMLAVLAANGPENGV